MTVVPQFATAKQKMAENQKIKLKPAVVEDLLKLHFEDKKSKMSKDALTLMTECIKIFISEAVYRAAYQAAKEMEKEVTLEHLEKILPQLLLDF